MKAPLAKAKKSTPLLMVHKPLFSINPYNDLPLAAHTKSSKQIGQAQKNAAFASEGPSNTMTKYLKFTSPQNMKSVILSTSTIKDSSPKIKIGLANPTHKLNKKLVKKEKLSQYFDADVKPQKTGKNLANASKMSAESNSTLKSAHSENHKALDSLKTSNKFAKGNFKTIETKNFALVVKNNKPQSIHKNQIESHQNLGERSHKNQLKPSDNRKSYSYTGLSAQKSGSETSGKKMVSLRPQVKPSKNIAGNYEKTLFKAGTDMVLRPVRSQKQINFVPSLHKVESMQLKPIESTFSTYKDQQILNDKLTKSKNSVQSKTNKSFDVGEKIQLTSVDKEQGTKIFTFRIIKILARDDRTLIMLVVQQQTNFLYCLKKCEVLEHPTSENSMLNKIDFLIKQSMIGRYLDHPYLVKTYCTLYDQRNLYHLMQFTEGDNLYERNKRYFCTQGGLGEKPQQGLQKNTVTKQVLKITSIKEILSQVLEAVSYLHERDITHRDLKPANILITHENTFKVADFGTAIRGTCSEPIGTLDYAAPEIMLKEKYSKSVDMWSIGCLAYELYVGYPPFFNQNRDATIMNIVECKYDPSKVQNELLLNFISRLLQRRGDKRLIVTEAMAHPFFRELDIS